MPAQEFDKRKNSQKGRKASRHQSFNRMHLFQELIVCFEELLFFVLVGQGRKEGREEPFQRRPQPPSRTSKFATSSISCLPQGLTLRAGHTPQVSFLFFHPGLRTSVGGCLLVVYSSKPVVLQPFELQGANDKPWFTLVFFRTPED